jgi:hypothetical protein
MAPLSPSFGRVSPRIRDEVVASERTPTAAATLGPVLWNQKKGRASEEARP